MILSLSAQDGTSVTQREGPTVFPLKNNYTLSSGSGASAVALTKSLHLGLYRFIVEFLLDPLFGKEERDQISHVTFK